MKGLIVGDLAASEYEFGSIRNEYAPIFEKNCNHITFNTLNCLAAVYIYNNFYDRKMNKEERLSLISKKLKSFILPYYHYVMEPCFQMWLTNGNYDPYESIGAIALLRVSAFPKMAIKESMQKEHIAEIGFEFAEVTHNSQEVKDLSRAYIYMVYDLLKIKNRINELSKEDFKKIAIDALSPVNIDYIDDQDYLMKIRGININENSVSARDILERSVAIVALSKNYEEAIRKAISLGGSVGILSSLVGVIAEIVFGLPKEFEEKIKMNKFDDLLTESIHSIY